MPIFIVANKKRLFTKAQELSYISPPNGSFYWRFFSIVAQEIMTITTFDVASDETFPKRMVSVQYNVIKDTSYYNTS